MIPFNKCYEKQNYEKNHFQIKFKSNKSNITEV